nr:fatty acyl-AMP ligase [Myxococcota bacterium]
MRDLPPRSDDLATLLARAAVFARAGVVFVDRHENEVALDYVEVHRRARAAAAHLKSIGVRRSDRVAIVLPTGPEFLDAFFGCQLLGAVPVPLYPPVRLGRLDEYVERTAALVRIAECVAVIADRRTRRLLGEVVALARPPLGTIGAEALALHPVDPTERITGPRDAPRPDDLALVQFSSGTTRTPAAVALTHRQVLANVESITESLPDRALAEDGGCVCWLPLYHDMGLVGCVLATIRCGRKLVLLPPEAFLAKPALWLRAIARHRATVSTAPDFAYARCLEKVRDEELEGMSLASWQVAMNGAEPVAPRTLRAFHDRFARFGLGAQALTPVYGLSEATLAVTFSDPAEPFRATAFDRDALSEGTVRATAGGLELVSLGRPLRGFEVRIRDDARADLAEDRVGRVWVRGPSVMSGYLGDAPSPLHEGWLDTGDVGFVHEGDLYVCGRAKDVVVVRGRNHAPHDIERACDGIDGVRTGCTVAVSEIDSDGERLLVFVELREGAKDVDPRAVERRCREEIVGRTGLDPARIVLLSAGTLPRTSSGKLRRGETLRRWIRRELEPARAVTPVFLASALARSVFG